MKKYAIIWNTGYSFILLDYDNISSDNNGNPVLGTPKQNISTLKEASQIFRKLILLFPNHDLEIIEL